MKPCDGIPLKTTVLQTIPRGLSDSPPYIALRYSQLDCKKARAFEAIAAIIVKFEPLESPQGHFIVPRLSVSYHVPTDLFAGTGPNTLEKRLAELELKYEEAGEPSCSPVPTTCGDPGPSRPNLPKQNVLEKVGRSGLQHPTAHLWLCEHGFSSLLGGRG